MIHRGVVVAAVATVAFCAGWGVHALLTPEPEHLAPQRAVGDLPSASAAPVPMPSVSSTSSTPSTPSTQQVFDEIYRSGKWGRNEEDAGSSGFGSKLTRTLVYRAFLQQFMATADVHSVVDAGCGDWESSRTVDWKGIDYKGYDIVASVIDADTRKYGKPGVQFFVANIVDADLPPADLLICKHVLQHLPEADVLKFLKQLPKYKHVLLVDSVNPETLSAKNRDIAAGSFRELDVTRPPFNVMGAKVLTYWDGGNMQQVVYVPRQS